MNITLTQSDIKRIIKDVEDAISVIQTEENSLAKNEEIKERLELVQYLKYNVKLNARDGKK